MKFWRPLTQHALTPAAARVDRAQGAYLYAGDAQILDAISSWWTVTHGHSQPNIQAAIADQLAQLSQAIFTQFTHDPAERLAAELGKLLPSELPHLFLSDSGSTAVEVALKMAVGAWYHRGFSQRHKIVTFKNSYHGAALGATSLGARGVFSKPHEGLLFEVLRVPSPAVDSAACMDGFKKILAKHSDEIAALIVEPLVQGAGGMQFYDAAALNELYALCKSHDIFLIFDEVMTGFGRTGSLFAFQQTQIIPDIVCLAKGITGGFLPMGATIACDETYQAFYAADKARMLFHSTSYTGNALACAAAAANAQLWQQREPRAQWQNLIHAQTHTFSAWQKIPQLQNVRQCGTILAAEIALPQRDYLSPVGAQLAEFSLQNGVLLRPLGNTVYLMPPYCSSAADLQKTTDVLTAFFTDHPCA